MFRLAKLTTEINEKFEENVMRHLKDEPNIKSKGGRKMFKKNKEVKVKAIDELRKKAIAEDDMETLDILNDISKEHGNELFKERLKCMVIGAGLTHVGFIIGAAAVKWYESSKKEA